MRVHPILYIDRPYLAIVKADMKVVRIIVRPKGHHGAHRSNRVVSVKLIAPGRYDVSPNGNAHAKERSHIWDAHERCTLREIIGQHRTERSVAAKQAALRSC